MLTWQPHGHTEPCVDRIAVRLVAGGHCHNLMPPESEQAVQVCTRTAVSGKCSFSRGDWPAPEGRRKSLHDIPKAPNFAPWRNLCCNEHDLHIHRVSFLQGSTAWHAAGPEICTGPPSESLPARACQAGC